MVYDDANRLSRLTVAGQGSEVVTHYTYDGLGQRASKNSGSEAVDTVYDESGLRLVDETFDINCDSGTSSAAPSQPPASSASTSSVICAGGGLAVITPKSRTEYLYLDGLPVLLARYQGSNPTVQLSYLHTDHLGTPRVAINVGSGAQQWRWDLPTTAFGDHLPVVSESGYELNMRYPGQFYDKESGLHHNYFRDYEPKTGRYIESDPIGLRGGAATFNYVQNSPLKSTDPSGLETLGIHSSAFNNDRSPISGHGWIGIYADDGTLLETWSAWQATHDLAKNAPNGCDCEGSNVYRDIEKNNPARYIAHESIYIHMTVHTP